MIPYLTDQLAMVRLPRATYSLMLALLPVTATACGIALLHQLPGRQDLVGHRAGRRGRRRPPNTGNHRAKETRLMEYATLGASGLVVSPLVLGMMSYGNTSRRDWHLDLDGARPIVRRAVEGGVTVFDTADMYDLGASEEVTGPLLRELFGSREEYVVATKVFYPMSDAPGDAGLSRKHVLAAADASLRRLGTDHIDLYQIHRWDDATPIEETMEALDSLVRAGKVRYLGASSMWAWQFAKAQHVAERNGWHRFVSMQNHYNLAYREEEREMIPLCLDQGVGVLPYSPLARGLLTGSRRRDGGGTTTRSTNDPARRCALRPRRLRRGRRPLRGGPRPRPAAGAGGAGLAADAARASPHRSSGSRSRRTSRTRSPPWTWCSTTTRGAARGAVPPARGPEELGRTTGQARSRWLTASAENSWSTTRRVNPTTAASSPSAPSCRAMCRVARGRADR